MLSREFLRENASELLAEMPERYAGSGIERFVELDLARRAGVTRLEEKRRRRNELTAVRGKPEPEVVLEMKALKEEIRALEEETERAEAELGEVETGIPNAPQSTVSPSRSARSGRNAMSCLPSSGTAPKPSTWAPVRAFNAFAPGE